MVLKRHFISFMTTKDGRTNPPDNHSGGITMKIRNFILGIAITAIATFAGIGFNQYSSGADVLAGPGTWITDGDVG